MMLGKRKQTTAPWKGTLKKWPKRKKIIPGLRYNPKVVSARLTATKCKEIKYKDQTSINPSTMYHQSLYMQP